MEAANRGAHEVGAASVGLNITLPEEQQPNPYLTPELSFQFRYFALRKLHFMLRARALVALPGGYGTFDELFETLCLIQTGRRSALPVILGFQLVLAFLNYDLQNVPHEVLHRRLLGGVEARDEEPRSEA